MPHDFVESACERHGLERHIVVHEAGHVVAALHCGIQFRAAVLYGDEGRPTVAGGVAHAAAAVEMLSDDPTTWVEHDRVNALRFVLAGSLSEIAILDHAIDGGYDGDVWTWRHGMRSTEAMTPAQVDELIGRSFLDVVRETQSWADANSDTIEFLAGHLEALTPPAEMPYADIEVLLT